ncbi:hypothetical protein J6590_003733 [Homalodisca vitripennis]|nr:hypothetical protein J6590_003733 [Homalodisca vitripennis]
MKGCDGRKLPPTDGWGSGGWGGVCQGVVVVTEVMKFVRENPPVKNLFGQFLPNEITSNFVPTGSPETKNQKQVYYDEMTPPYLHVVEGLALWYRILPSSPSETRTSRVVNVIRCSFRVEALQRSNVPIFVEGR